MDGCYVWCRLPQSSCVGLPWLLSAYRVNLHGAYKENLIWQIIPIDSYLSDKLESKKFGKVVTIFKIDEEFKDDILDLQYISLN